MKKHNRLLAIGLSAVMLFMSIPFPVLAGETAETVNVEESSIPGNPAYSWCLTDGVLKIYDGNNEPLSIEDRYIPWAEYKSYIKKVELGSQVKPTSMNRWFEGCSLEAAPVIPDTVTSLDYTFAGCDLKQAPVIPESVTSMNGTFEGCDFEQAPVIPESVGQMYSTFSNCTSLKTAPVIPKNVTYSGYTFSGCKALSGNIFILSGATSIDEYFNGVTNPLTVYYGGSCTKKFAEKIAATGENVTIGGTAYPEVLTRDVTVELGATKESGFTISGYTTQISYLSSDDAIASVDKATGRVTGIAPGTTTIIALLGQFDGTNLSVTHDVTVTDVPPVIVSEPGDVSVTFDEDAVFSVTASGTNNKYQWYMSDDAESTGTAIEGAESETYTIAKEQLSLDLDGKYFYCTVSNYGNEAVSTTPVKLSVLAVRDGKLMADAIGYEGVYDGKEHTADIRCAGADIRYGLTEGVYVLDEIPVFQTAGKYRVYYEAVLEGYETVTGNVPVVIHHPSDTGGVTIEDWTYDSTPSEPVIASEIYDINTAVLTWAERDSEEFTDTMPKYPGLYTVKVSFADTAEREGMEVFYNFAILEDVLNVTGEDYTCKYTGRACAANIICDKEDVTIHYGFSPEELHFTAMPSVINAGEYTIYYEVSKEHYKSVTGSVTITITKADGSGKLDIMDYAYGKNMVKIVESKTNGATGTTYYKKLNAPDDTYTTKVPTEVGTYAAKMILPETANFNELVLTDTFSILKPQSSGINVSNNVTDNTTQKPDVSLGYEDPKIQKGDEVTIGGVIYECVSVKNGKPAFMYICLKSKKATVTIPATITYQGVSCNVVSIAEGAFKNDKKLQSITIGKNVETIGSNAFMGCMKLKTVTIKSTALSGIGNNAFSGCKALKKVTIPKTVKKIGKNAFKNCKSLKQITIKSKYLTKKTVGKDAFKGISAKAKIKVPGSKVKAYKSLLKSKGVSGKAKITK